MSDIVEEYRQKKVAKLCKEARELCAESSFAAPSGSAAGTLRIEIDFKEQPSEYGGAPHLRMMRAIEAAYPDAKNRTASRMTWHSKPPNDKVSHSRE